MEVVAIKTGGPGETGEIPWVPKRSGVSWIVGSKGVEECRGRVTAFGSHKWTKGLVATVRSLLGKITSGSGVSMTTGSDREVLGLSEKANKASAVEVTVMSDRRNSRSARNRR